MTGRKSLWLAVICTCVLAAGAPAAVIISDAFAGHANGANLKSTVTDAAGATTTATWNGGSSGGGGFVFQTGDYVQGAAARVNYVPYTPAVGDIYTVSAKMSFPTSGKGILGFDYANGSYPQAGGNAYGLLVFLEVYDTGAWWLKYKNTSGTNVTTGISGNVGALTAGTFHPIALRWDPATKTANAWIDGTQVLTNRAVSAINAGAVAYAGFGNNGTANLKVDDFVVSAVPEPVTLVLLCSGAGLAMLRRRS